MKHGAGYKSCPVFDDVLGKILPPSGPVSLPVRWASPRAGIAIGGDRGGRRKGWEWENTELACGLGQLGEGRPSGDRAPVTERGLRRRCWLHQSMRIVQSAQAASIRTQCLGERDSAGNSLFQECKEFVFAFAEETRSQVFGAVTPGYDFMARLRCVCSSAPVGSPCPARACERSVLRSLCKLKAQLGHHPLKPRQGVEDLRVTDAGHSVSFRREVESVLPPDAHEQAHSRLHVSVSNTKTRENVLVSSFSSREDLIQVTAALAVGARGGRRSCFSRAVRVTAFSTARWPAVPATL